MKLRYAMFFSVLAAPVAADISDEANACIDALREQGAPIGGEVLGQQGSEAGTLVRLKDGNCVEYECIVWSGPEVAELRVADGSSATAQADSPIASGTQRVQFAKGTSGMTATAVLNAGTSVRYVLGAKDGQFLNVDVQSRGGALDYKIENPDGSLLLDLIASDTPYQGQLWQSGDHVVEILNAGAEPVTFDIGIGIN